MDRNDWVLVGVRIIGLGLLPSAAQSVLNVALMPVTAPPELGFLEPQSGLGFAARSHTPTVLGHGLLGALLWFRAPAIDRWLRARDSSA